MGWLNFGGAPCAPVAQQDSECESLLPPAFWAKVAQFCPCCAEFWTHLERNIQSLEVELQLLPTLYWLFRGKSATTEYPTTSGGSELLFPSIQKGPVIFVRLKKNVFPSGAFENLWNQSTSSSHGNRRQWFTVVLGLQSKVGQGNGCDLIELSACHNPYGLRYNIPQIVPLYKWQCLIHSHILTSTLSYIFTYWI